MDNSLEFKRGDMICSGDDLSSFNTGTLPSEIGNNLALFKLNIRTNFFSGLFFFAILFAVVVLCFSW